MPGAPFDCPWLRNGYGAAGRITSVTTSGGTTTLSYDYGDRVTSITLPGGTTDSFTYNGLDARTGKTDSTGTYTFKRDGANVTDPVLSDSAAAYTPGVSERRSGASAFYHEDRLGSTTKITNASQTVTDTRQYDAFGMLISSTGSNPTPFGFVAKGGYQQDSDSGLMLLGHRYYDPSIGRFLTRDPAKDGLNWYGYCQNNATRLTDPTGWQVAPKEPRPTPPPFDVPWSNGKGKWAWRPRSPKSPGGRPGKWVPDRPVNVPNGKGGQPGASWDPVHGHWDLDLGNGERIRMGNGDDPMLPGLDHLTPVMAPFTGGQGLSMQPTSNLSGWALVLVVVGYILSGGGQTEPAP